MNWKRILIGKVSVVYHPACRWLSLGISRYWSGRLIYINVSKFYFIIDRRLNEDMITGFVKVL